MHSSGTEGGRQLRPFTPTKPSPTNNAIPQPDMPEQFTLEYATFAFFGALGVVQAAAAANGLRGILFIRGSPRWSAALGLVTVVASFTWYFASAPRNVPDTAGGLDGNVQARWLAIAGATAVGFTFLVTSAINHRWGRTPDEELAGMDALRETTFLRALAFRIKRLLGRTQSWTAR